MNATRQRRYFTLPEGVARPALAEQRPRAGGICLTCGDTGYIVPDLPSTDPRFGRAVRCPQCGAQTIAAVCGLNERERSLTADAIKGQKPEAKLLRGLAADLIARPHGWLVLWGAFGNAKSMFAQIVVAELVRRGVESRFARALDVEEAFFSDVKSDTNHLPRYRDVRVLVLDEAEKVNYRSEWTRAHWQAVLDARYRTALAEQSLTIFTMNADPSADGSPIPGDVHSRMNDGRFCRPAFAGVPPAYTIRRWEETVVPPVIHLGGTDARPYIRPGFIAASVANGDRP